MRVYHPPTSDEYFYHTGSDAFVEGFAIVQNTDAGGWTPFQFRQRRRDQDRADGERKW